MDFSIGQQVYFGRTHGEKTLGEVIKVNRTTVKVRQLETRGVIKDHRVGTVWTVPKRLATPADAGAQPVAKAPVTPRAQFQRAEFPKRACLVNVLTGEKTYGRLCYDENEYEFECEMLYERLANAC